DSRAPVGRIGDSSANAADAGDWFEDWGWQPRPSTSAEAIKATGTRTMTWTSCSGEQICNSAPDSTTRYLRLAAVLIGAGQVSARREGAAAPLGRNCAEKRWGRACPAKAAAPPARRPDCPAPHRRWPARSDPRAGPRPDARAWAGPGRRPIAQVLRWPR